MPLLCREFSLLSNGSFQEKLQYFISDVVFLQNFSVVWFVFCWFVFWLVFWGGWWLLLIIFIWVFWLVGFLWWGFFLSCFVSWFFVVGLFFWWVVVGFFGEVGVRTHTKTNPCSNWIRTFSKEKKEDKCNLKL